MLLPDTPSDGAVIFAEKLRAHIEAEAIDNPARGKLTVSVGIATFPEDADNAVALVEAADSQLYAAKSGGRNTVRAS